MPTAFSDANYSMLFE